MAHFTRLLMAACVLSQLACSPPPPSGPVIIDGSSTVLPLTEAVAADVMKSNRGTEVKLSWSGTVDGFARFCQGQLDVVDASRPIKTEEQAVLEVTPTAFLAPAP